MGKRMRRAVGSRWALGLLAVVVAAGCRTDEDCELNGVCGDDGGCLCDVGWAGASCSALELAPVAVHSGYRQAATASWGGNVVRHEGQFHLFVAEMEGGCGLKSWLRNSRVVRAVAEREEGPYRFEQEVLPIWAHNPQIAQAEDGSGTHLLFHIGLAQGRPAEPCAGHNGTTPCGFKQQQEEQHQHQHQHKQNQEQELGRQREQQGEEQKEEEQHTFPLHYSASLTGPWERHVANISFDVGSNANPSPVVLRNGTVLVLFHAQDFAIAEADHWRGPYRLRSRHSCGAGEDPFLYVDRRGRFHCLSHGAPFDRPTHSIVHSFSADGYSWTASPHVAAGSRVRFDNGRQVLFSKRERPKLLFDDAGDVSALVSGVTLTPQCTPAFLYPDGHAALDDACDDEVAQYHLTNENRCPGHFDRAFTLIQSVARKRARKPRLSITTQTAVV